VRCLLGLWLSCLSLLALAQPDPFPEVAASYRVDIDGTPVWQRQATRQLAPASLTKLMTALLVAEDGQLDAIATVSRAAARETGSRAGLKAGEKFHVRDLLAAALIASANDACVALADHLAGDEQHFVQRMNQRAMALGLLDTHFSNACGHDAIDHYSSVRDLAQLAHEVIKHSSITQLAIKPDARIATLDGAKSYDLKNSNALIGRYPGALGLKTGYTPKAGKCLVAYARRGNTEVLLVMLKGSDRWWDAVDILDLAFAHARNAP